MTLARRPRWRWGINRWWVLLFIIFMLLIERFVLVRLERYLFRWRLEDQA